MTDEVCQRSKELISLISPFQGHASTVKSLPDENNQTLYMLSIHMYLFIIIYDYRSKRELLFRSDDERCSRFVFSLKNREISELRLPKRCFYPLGRQHDFSGGR